MRCLVTGASGHLGASLVRLLVLQGEQVICLVRPQSDLWRLSDVLDKVQLVQAELGEYQSVRDQIIAARPEAIYHLAWYGVTADKRNDPAQITRNVAGTLQLAEIVHSAGCKTWVGVGSQAEYGPYDVPLQEKLIAHPVTTYGVSKYCSGLLIEKMCDLVGMRFVWVRLLATYGPKDDPRHLIPSVIHKLLAREKPSLTTGEQQWDYLYVDDAAQAIERLGQNAEARGFYNLGSGQTRSVRHIVEYIRDLIDPSLPLGLGDLQYRPDQVMFLRADISRLCQITGWRPAVSLEDGLARTVNWYKKNR